MKTIFYTNNTTISGASVRGVSHKENRLPNQDSFLCKKNKNGVVLVAADGVGSHKYSKRGSISVCKAVCKVFDLYLKKKIAKDDIGKTIEFFYKKLIKKRYSCQAATTCLFALIYNNSEIIIGQAGDGVILLRVDDRFVVFKNKNDDFLNEVSTLDCKREFSNWKIKNLKVDFDTNYRIQIMLSTDGISEDIKPDKREICMDFFINKAKQKYGILHELTNWQVPGSFDDKTVVIFSWEKQNEGI